MAKPRQLKPNRAMVALFNSLLEQAKAGRLTAACIVLRANDGTYDEICETDDIDDMMLEMRTAVIRLQCANRCPLPEVAH